MKMGIRLKLRNGKNVEELKLIVWKCEGMGM